MKVFILGKGAITLSQSDYVATGGQASVYVKKGTAYKIYTNPKDMLPSAKFNELLKIADDHVIKPEDLILDGTGTSAPIGYNMRAVPDNPSALCQLFTRAYRDRNNIDDHHIIKILYKLQQHVKNVHDAGVLVVDLNELNLLVPDTYDDVYLIDVDSYQTKMFPATVIMPSVRDWSVASKDFSPLSDWYSLGVLAFQLFIGIHPYKSGYDPVNHIPKDQRMEYRMKHNISAFRPDVRLPKCCYDLNVIPQHYREWLKAVLEDGKRLAPPDPRGGQHIVVAPVVVAQTLSDALVINLFQDFDGWKLTAYSENNLGSVAYLTGVNSKKEPEGRAMVGTRTLYSKQIPAGVVHVGHTPKMNHPVGLYIFQERLTFINFTKKTEEVLNIRATALTKRGDRFYIKCGSEVREVSFLEMNDEILVTASHKVAGVMEQASQLYEGCAIQSMLGAAYVSLFPESRKGFQVRMLELDDYRIMDAKFDGGVLMVVGSLNGKYNRMIFRFDDKFSTYDQRTIQDITPSGLNFITLQNGVCISLTEEEKIEAFSAKKDSTSLKIVEDKAIGNDMRLIKLNGKAGFIRGDKAYQMSLK